MRALKIVHKSPASGKKDYINRSILSEPKTGVKFSDFITVTVNRKAKRNGASYKKNYKTLIYHLLSFSQKHDVDIYTNSVNEDFLDDFICYLEELNLRQNYIKSILCLIKSMVKKAGQYGYAVDRTYDDVDVDGEIPFTIFLSSSEITRIYYFKGLTKKQGMIRDLFVVGCLTGLRYSDYSTLKKENFDPDFITKITKKTRTKVVIPLHDFVKEIYQKYDGEIPTGLSIQHFNRYIKNICKNIGLTDPIKFSYTKGGKIVTETKEKWELISSHTARRSAATNMYMTKRMTAYEIMAITGHSTEKSFFRYIKVTKEDAVKNIAGDSYFRK